MARTPPAPGTLLYEADWSRGLDGWPSVFGWKSVDGMLVSDGTNRSISNWVAAPYEPGRLGVTDYAVEAEIQLVRRPGVSGNFGIVVRDSYQAAIGLFGGCGGSILTLIGSEIGGLVNRAFEPGDSWHLYRVEVKGNLLSVAVDGAVFLETGDNRYLTGGKVGVYHDSAHVSVRRFKVIAL